MNDDDEDMTCECSKSDGGNNGILSISSFSQCCIHTAFEFNNSNNLLKTVDKVDPYDSFTLIGNEILIKEQFGRFSHSFTYKDFHNNLDIPILNSSLLI